MKWMSITSFISCLILIYMFSPRGEIWSPYHHVTISLPGEKGVVPFTKPPDNIRSIKDPPIYEVRVNQDFYQVCGTLDLTRYTEGTELYNKAKGMYYQFTIPYQLKPSPPKILVVGAGSGKDIEAALLNNAQHIDAVEIDPVLVEISRRFNASGVYFDPRVHVSVNDARAFFTNAQTNYDMVVFSYLDSQALFSSMSNIRLDGFVYTIESLRKAYSLLNEDGILVLSFRGPGWIYIKLAAMLSEASGKEPIVYQHQDGQISILVPKGKHLIAPSSYGGFEKNVFSRSALLEESKKSTLATDDWPFLYLRERNIPADYLSIIIALILISSLILFGVSHIKWGTEEIHFFFLGMGFLLLETKSVIDASLYFGTTWLVTTVVIAGILLMSLGANLTAMHLRSFKPYFYLPLVVSLIFLLSVSSRFILGLSGLGRILWVLIFIPLPIFTAGIIFSTTFRNSKNASSCFGANLIGATVGGFLEYLGMAVGYKNLSLLVIGAYLASLIFIIRKYK